MSISRKSIQLISAISFFFICTSSLKAIAAEKRIPAQTLSALVEFSGDLQGSVQFNGATGTEIEGQAKFNKPCAIKAYFRPVFYQNQNKIEITLSLTCPGKQQALQKFSPPRFFVEPGGAGKKIDFVGLSNEFKKIHLQWTEIKISQKQAK